MLIHVYYTTASYTCTSNVVILRIILCWISIEYDNIGFLENQNNSNHRGLQVGSKLEVEHKRRKILRVGGAEYPTVREARVKILRPRPLCVKPRPFLHDRGCYNKFLDEK